MADAVTIPDEILSRVRPDPAQTEAAAAWAATFGKNPVSLAQRRRYESDLSGYAQQLLESRQAAEVDRLERSTGARQLYLANQKMQMQSEAAAAKARIDAANQQRAAELHPLKLKSERRKAEAASALERRRIAEEAHKSLLDTHENSFFADRAEFLANNPSATQEQIDANDIAIADRYQHARRGTAAKDIITLAERNSLARQTEARKAAAAKAQADANAAIASLEKMAPTGISAAGTVTYAKPKQEGAASADPMKRLEHLERLRMKASVDPYVKAYLDEEIAKVKSGATAPALRPPLDELLK